MPEYLSPGVYVEEVSFRSKSIEGVSTTTTGFVGPARYGPTEIAPDVLTSVLDFERVYGDRRQLMWSGDQYHNYLWHAVRAFFEEGGKRLYVARAFKPLKDQDGEELTATYDPPAPELQADRARRSAGKLYEQDGHARLWLTKETAALSAVAEALRETLTTINETQAQSALAKLRADNAARLAKEPAGAGDATAATKRSAEKAQKLFSTVDSSFDVTTTTTATAVNALPNGTLPATLLDASGSARDTAKTAVDEAALSAAGALKPATSTDAAHAADAVVAALAGVILDATAAATNATAAKTAANGSAISPAAKAAFVVAETKVFDARTTVGQAGTLAGTAQTSAGSARTAYENAAANAPARARAAETSALELAAKADEAVADAITALAAVTGAQSMSADEIGLPDGVRNAAALSKDAAEKLLASARKAAAAAQDFRGQASGALARATAAQDLLAKLDQAVANANAAATEYTDNTIVRAQEAQDAVTAPAATASQPVKDAVAAANLAAVAAKAAADAASLLVADVKPAVLLAKATLDDPASDAGTKVQTVQAAKDKVTAATLSLNNLVSKAADATSKTAGVVAHPDFPAVSPTTVRTKITNAGTAAAAAEALVGPAVTTFANAAVEVNKLPGNLTGAAADAAANAAGAAVTALQALEGALQIARRTVQDKENDLADKSALFAGALTDEDPLPDPNEAVLLRARFPGAYGNLPIRFSLRLGDNLLRGAPGKVRAAGLQAGDFVWIGTQPAAGATVETGDLLLATKDEQTQEWRFGPNSEKANLEYWLNRGTDNSKPQLDPAAQFLRVATIAVTVTQNDGTSETWDGLAPQPTHTRAGAPDALTAKFSPEPASAADARMLPIVILTDHSMTTAGALFKTLFGRLDTTLELPHGSDRLEIDLTLVGGNDGQRPGAAEYEGREKEHGKTGLKALEDVDEIAIVATPGATYGLNNGYRSDAETIFGLVISHAEHMRYRIAVLDSGNNQSIGEVRATCAKLDSNYAALYYPWVKVLDPVTRREIYLPPSGFVTGIYARNDITRAVYKAPANEVVNLAIGFEIILNKSQQDVLNPLGINCFRYFPGRGFRLWGARMLSSDPEWKYVNLRRYFAYVEHSIDKSTQWAVFEPNGERLWDNVRRTIYDFLLNEWQNGALLGEKPDKAFFVRCDRSTMTQNDLDNGRLVCLIGLAPLRPAEFVIFKIGQWTADHKV